MKKLRITLMIMFGSFFFMNGAIAQNKPLACQVDASAGLKWENERWQTKNFELSRFILVQARNTLTVDSVGKVLGARPINVSCRNIDPLEKVECTDASAGSLYFDLKTFKGGISQLHGSVDTSALRDTVTVQIFSCTPF